MLLDNCSNVSMEVTFINVENSKMNEPHIFFRGFWQRLDLKCSYKDFALQNLSIYYTWKNIRQ